MPGGTSSTVREVTRQLLRQLGLTTVFGNPGTTEVPFLLDWPDDFRYVLGLQESAVVGMADGYATAAGRPVLVNLHSAGGVGHALGAVFTGFRNRTPMVIIAGQQVRSLLPQDPFLGAIDAPDFPRPYVKWSVEPARAEDVPAAVLRAYRMAIQPPCGPVFVSVPADDWDVPCDPIQVPAELPTPSPDEAVVEELADRLRTCERPLFVAGPAVAEDDAVLDLVTLAERTGAAVWSAPMSSRASFPENHARFQGFLRPEQNAIADTVADSDLLVVFGAPSFTYHVFRGAAARALPSMYVLSDDPEILARMPHGQGIATGLGAALRALLPKVPRSDRIAPAARARPALPAARTPPTGGQVIDTLAGVLPENAVVVEEAPTHRADIQAYLRINAPEQDFFSVASGTLGYGLPAAVGAALAEPRRRVIAILGDGSSMYGIQALWTAVRAQTEVTFLVLDNESYAAVGLLGGVGEEKLPGVELGGIDFAGLAAGLGCLAHRVTELSTLETALTESFAEARPTLLHVPVAPSTHQMY